MHDCTKNCTNPSIFKAFRCIDFSLTNNYFKNSLLTSIKTRFIIYSCTDGPVEKPAEFFLFTDPGGEIHRVPGAGLGA